MDARRENHKITCSDDCVKMPLTPLHSLKTGENIAGFPPTVGAFFRLTERDLVRIIDELGSPVPFYYIKELRTTLRILIGFKYFPVGDPRVSMDNGSQTVPGDT